MAPQAADNYGEFGHAVERAVGAGPSAFGSSQPLLAQVLVVGLCGAGRLWRSVLVSTCPPQLIVCSVPAVLAGEVT